MHYSLLLCFTLHIVLTVIMPISFLNITVQDFVNIHKAQDLLILTVRPTLNTECFLYFLFDEEFSTFKGVWYIWSIRKRLSTTDQLLNPCLMFQKVLRNLKAKPCGDDYTGVLVLGKQTHLSIVWLTIVLQPLRENSYWFVSGQVFRFEAHVFSKDRGCMKK